MKMIRWAFLPLFAMLAFSCISIKGDEKKVATFKYDLVAGAVVDGCTIVSLDPNDKKSLVYSCPPCLVTCFDGTTKQISKSCEVVAVDKTNQTVTIQCGCQASTCSYTFEPALEPQIEPTLEPVQESQVEPSTEPQPETVVELQPEPTQETQQELVQEVAQEVLSEPVAEPVVEPVVEAGSEVVTEPVQEAVADGGEVVTEPAVEAVQEPVTEAAAEVQQETSSETVAEQSVEPTQETVQDGGGEVVPEPSTEPTVEATPEPETCAATETLIQGICVPNSLINASGNYWAYDQARARMWWKGTGWSAFGVTDFSMSDYLGFSFSCSPLLGGSAPACSAPTIHGIAKNVVTHIGVNYWYVNFPTDTRYNLAHPRSLLNDSEDGWQWFWQYDPRDYSILVYEHVKVIGGQKTKWMQVTR